MREESVEPYISGSHAPRLIF